MKLLASLVVFLSAIVLGATVVAAGIAQPHSARIVKGSEVRPHSAPHQVVLYSGKNFKCGGALISNQWVLTAAHCVDGDSSLRVIMGAHDRTKGESSQVIKVSSTLIKHSQWTGSVSQGHDIALIKLPEPVEYCEHIQAIRLPSRDVSVGASVTATGWGKTTDRKPYHQSGWGQTVQQPFYQSRTVSPYPSKLREVDVSVMDNVSCKRALGSIIKAKIGAGVVCTHSYAGKGVCQGDSGGPLVQGGEIVGLTSFVVSTGCEAGYPSVFTRVYHYVDWIKSITGIRG